MFTKLIYYPDFLPKVPIFSGIIFTETFLSSLWQFKFYLKYYYLLCEEIETLPEGKLKNELEITKYRLMMILDGMFDNTLFMNKDNSNLEDYKGKISS